MSIKTSQLVIIIIIIIIVLHRDFSLWAQELLSSLDISTVKEMKDSIRRGIEFLEANQDPNGSWSHSPDITALCLMAISHDSYRHEREKNRAALKTRAYLSMFLEETIESPMATDNKDTLATISMCLTALAMSIETNKKSIYLRTIRSLAESGKQLWKPGVTSILPNLYKRHLILEALYIIENHPDIPPNSNGLDMSSIWENAKAYTKSCQIIDKKLETISEEAIGSFTSIPVSYVFPHLYPEKNRFKLERCILTFAGIKSLVYCGVSKNDVSISHGLKWLQDSCPVKELPVPGNSGFFTYLYMLGSTMRFTGHHFGEQSGCNFINVGLKIIETTLANQKGDGSWINSNGMWRENNPFLCSAYAILTLANIAYAIS